MLKRERPTWELRNMIKALSMLPWLNTAEETQRLENAKKELSRRNQQGFIAKGKSNV